MLKELIIQKKTDVLMDEEDNPIQKISHSKKTLNLNNLSISGNIIFNNFNS